MGNATLIETLKDDIAAGRVVVIAGTGVSVVASGNPKIAGHHVATWTGLHWKSCGPTRTPDSSAVTWRGLGRRSVESPSS